MSAQSFERTRWSVVSVEETDEFEEVFCAHVPGFHAFTLADNIVTGNCFGCGWNGDIIRFVQDADGLSFRDACEAITSGDLPLVDQQVLAAEKEEDERIRAEAIALAADIWDTSQPLKGTLGERYLLSRGIGILPDRFRFNRIPSWYDFSTGECGRNRPAIVCLVTDIYDRPIGIQRIFLADDGMGKAPDMANAKLSFGRPAGGAIRIGPQGGDHVVLVEGPEDGATVAQWRQDQPVFVACGTSMMPRMLFPDAIRRITIGADNGAAGMAAAAKARDEFMDRGLEVRVVYPDPGFSDWNDQHRGIRINGGR